ncbi:MAG: GGDEF domain-containing protein [bacterium]|nr:GGDEF domain-containing protein [bacterium]
MTGTKVLVENNEDRLLEKIAELEQTVRTLKEDLIHDTLTGLKTRAFFEQEAGVRLHTTVEHPRTQRRQWFGSSNFSIILFDIDYFKKINDAYGHLAGDGVLKAVCNNIAEGVRKADIVARWGGEEIVVALLGATEKVAMKKAENIRKDVERMGFNSLPGIEVTISGGVAATDESSATLEDMVRNADRALYRAKETGRNKIVAYSEILS